VDAQSQLCSLDLHACLFSHESEPDLHRIDVVISRLRPPADPPARAIFGTGLYFLIGAARIINFSHFLREMRGMRLTMP
jgi:hypothetical protein